jgi:hypothetical protein
VNQPSIDDFATRFESLNHTIAQLSFRSFVATERLLPPNATLPQKTTAARKTAQTRNREGSRHAE